MSGPGPRPALAQREALDALHARSLNFEPARRDELEAAEGWRFDTYCRALPPEPAGPPVPGSSWEVGARVLRDYEFADPGIVRAVYYPDQPLEHRTMLLEARFLFLRFQLGVRVGGVTDTTTEVDGRPVRTFGWNYRTLEGHLEMGQMDYEIWKFLDTGEVQFRIWRYVRRGRIPNPVVRLGFRLFGRWMQLRFVRKALDRMERLVTVELSAGEGRLRPAAPAFEVRPARRFRRAARRLEAKTSRE